MTPQEKQQLKAQLDDLMRQRQELGDDDDRPGDAGKDAAKASSGTRSLFPGIKDADIGPPDWRTRLLGGAGAALTAATNPRLLSLALQKVQADNAASGGENRSLYENLGRASRRIPAMLASGPQSMYDAAAGYFTDPDKPGGPAPTGKDYIERAGSAPMNLLRSLARPAQQFGTTAGDIAGTPAKPGGPERGVGAGLAEALRRDPGAPVEDFALPATMALEGAETVARGAKLAWGKDTPAPAGLSKGSDPAVARVAQSGEPYALGASYDVGKTEVGRPGELVDSGVIRRDGVGYDVGSKILPPTPRAIEPAPPLSIASQLKLNRSVGPYQLPEITPPPLVDQYGMTRPISAPAPKLDPFAALGGTPTQSVPSDVAPQPGLESPSGPAPTPLPPEALTSPNPYEKQTTDKSAGTSEKPPTGTADSRLVEIANRVGLSDKILHLAKKLNPAEIAQTLDVNPQMVEAVVNSGQKASPSSAEEIPLPPAKGTGLFPDEKNRVPQSEIDAYLEQVDREQEAKASKLNAEKQLGVKQKPSQPPVMNDSDRTPFPEAPSKRGADQSFEKHQRKMRELSDRIKEDNQQDRP